MKPSPIWNLTVTYTYSQFGLNYHPSAYARQLIKHPFTLGTLKGSLA